MPVIKIDKFDGGKDALHHQLLIGTNYCASASKNVWAPNGSLVKVPGMTELVSMTATAAASIDEMLADQTIVSTYQLYCYVATAAAINSNIYPFGIGITTNVDPLGYVTGSVSVSGASLISATGHSTSWSAHVSAGDRLRINASAGSWYRVSSIEDDTHLTLASAIPSAVASASDSNYLINPGLISGTSKNCYMVSMAGSWWAGGSGAILARYDSTGMTRIPTAPKATYWAAHKNFLFGFRTSTATSRLYWPKFKDPTTWPTNNFIDVDKDRGVGTGVFSFGDELILFKTNGIYRLLGDTFAPSQVTFDVEPIAVPKDFSFNSGKAVAIWKGIMVFYASGRIYGYEPGASGIKLISELYDLDLPTTVDNTTVAGVDAKARALAYGDNVIFKGIPGDYADAGILDRNGAWWYLTDGEGGYLGPGPIAIWFYLTRRPIPIFSDNGNLPRLVDFDIARHIVGDPTNYDKSFIGISDGAKIAINGRWVSKEINIGFGQFKHVVIYLRKQSAGNLTVEHSIDQGTFVSQTVDMTVGRGNMIRAVLQIQQVGSTMQLRLSNNVIDQTFEVFGIEIHYEERDENRQR